MGSLPGYEKGRGPLIDIISRHREEFNIRVEHAGWAKWIRHGWPRPLYCCLGGISIDGEHKNEIV